MTRLESTGSTVSRRDRISLTQTERIDYVRAARTMTLCSHGPGGYPHAVAMWFVVDDDETVWMTTYRKSQKALNVRRNRKVALSIESGTTYQSLKGVLIRGDAEVIGNTDVVLAVLERIHQKMYGAAPSGIGDAMRDQARKRAAIRVTPTRISSWDHAKLGGTY